MNSPIEVPPEDATAVEAAEAQALEMYGRRTNVLAAIEAVKSAASLTIDEGLERERTAFTRLRMSDEAFALPHMFFAERQAAKRGAISALVAAHIYHRLTRAALGACEALRSDGVSILQLEASVAALGLGGAGTGYSRETDLRVRRTLVRSMAEEALNLITEGVVESSADIDVVMVQRFGFPRWEGGPVFSASREWRES